MKKRILTVILTLLICIPNTFAANWVQYDEKKYLDTESINKESASDLLNRYSIWTKRLNDGSEPFKNMENILNKKIWYLLMKYTFDCDRKTIRDDDIVIYDLDNKPIYSNQSYSTSSVVPESNGEYLYNYVCARCVNNNPTSSTRTNYIPTQDGSNIRIKVKHRR